MGLFHYFQSQSPVARRATGYGFVLPKTTRSGSTVKPYVVLWTLWSLKGLLLVVKGFTMVTLLQCIGLASYIGLMQPTLGGSQQQSGSRPILVLELFTFVPRLFGTTSCCLSVQPVQLLPLRSIRRHISLIWPFPHRYRHSPWPVDVTELFPRLCC